MLKTIRHGIAFSLLLWGVILLVWASVPVRELMLVQTILPSEMRLPNHEQPGQAVLEERQVRLEWPNSMRIGDSGEIRLTFEPGGGDSIDGSPGTKFSNVYSQYNLMAEGRVEAAGVRVVPANPIRESLPDGQTIRYMWKITAEKTGVYAGTVWLSLRFLPLDGKEPIQSPIFITTINLRETSLWGISGPAARLLGGLGLLLGTGLYFDVMINLWRKLMKKNTINSSTGHQGTQ